MGEVRAPITGSVWQILVGVGDAFAEGDVVAVIESMKLEIPVEAEEPGTVTAILVAEGDAIDEDAPMLRFD